jgi:hypothetical protein
LIKMKLWISLMDVLRSWRHPMEMEFGIYYDVPNFTHDKVQHCKKPPTILVQQGLSSSQLPLVFMPLLTLVCPLSS